MAANLGLSSMQNWWKTKQQNNGSSDIPSDDILLHDVSNHAPQKHEAMGFSWLKMAWKCSLKGASFLGKMPSNDGVCCTKMGDGCCGDGRKNDDRYRKKNQRLQSVSWIIGFVFHWYTMFYGINENSEQI